MEREAPAGLRAKAVPHRSVAWHNGSRHIARAPALGLWIDPLDGQDGARPGQAESELPCFKGLQDWGRVYSLWREALHTAVAVGSARTSGRQAGRGRGLHDRPGLQPRMPALEEPMTRRAHFGSSRQRAMASSMEWAPSLTRMYWTCVLAVE